MIRLCILGTRAQAEAAAELYGIHHIGFELPEADEGRIGHEIIGMTDDEYILQVEEWFNVDPPEGLKPGALLWFKNA